MVPGRQIQLFAIGFAIAALVTAIVAVVVVVRRSDGPAVQDAKQSEHRIPAADIVKLKRDAVDMVVEAGDIKGVKVTDSALRSKLGLSEGDVITAISGRQIKRQYDVQDAIFGVSMLNASTIFVDVIHDHKPTLERWVVDGDLSTARRQAVDTALGRYGVTPPTIPGGTAGILGGSGSTSSNIYGGLVGADPDTVNDEIVAAIKKIDDTHVEVSRSAIDKVLANPMAVAKGARVVPAMKNGQPDGFKLYAIRPSSPYAALGFTNGDTIQAVNGLELRDASTALDIYTKLRSAKELQIDLLRRGQPMTLTITITP
jgi:type II secretory pathway component PulC